MARQVRVDVQVEGATALQKKARLLGEEDMPYLRPALERSGDRLAGAAASRAPGGIGRAVDFGGVSGKAHGLRANVLVKHPAAKATEFGRTTYYEGFTDRQQKKTGRPFRSAGQRARPFIGIKEGNAAIGSTKDEIRDDIADAVSKEWERLEP